MYNKIDNGGKEMTNEKLVSVETEFSNEQLQKIEEILEKGFSVRIYIDAKIMSMPTKENIKTQELFKQELIKHFGSRVLFVLHDGLSNYYYSYTLKG